MEACPSFWHIKKMQDIKKGGEQASERSGDLRGEGIFLGDRFVLGFLDGGAVRYGGMLLITNEI